MPNSKNSNSLFLIGLGLCDEGDISMRGMEILRACRFVFAEQYTNFVREGTFERLSARCGRKVQLLPREEVEGEKAILEAAMQGDTALVIPGDPLTATTHSSLIESARKAGISVHTIHSSSIFTAAPGACGLQIYKMGKTATITYWRENYRPTSFIDIVADNMSRGAHTLCLLDIDIKLGPMAPSCAIELILLAAKEKKLEQISKSTKIFVLWHAGWQDEKVIACTLGDYPHTLGSKSEPPGPAIIMIPGKMHFVEEDSYNYILAKQG